METKVVAFDTETGKILPGLLAPPLVCGSFCEPNEEGLVLDRDGTLARLQLHLERSDIIVGHNIAYDMAVVAAENDELIPLIFQAYLDGRIRDTKEREQLLDVKDGRMSAGSKNDPEQTPVFLVMRPDGWTKVSYHLVDLVQRHLNLDISEDKNDPSSWRLRYAELDGVPVEKWPRKAYEYAVNDAALTLAVYFRQQAYAGDPKYNYTDGDALVNERELVFSAFALHLMSCWGARTNPKRVSELKINYEPRKEKMFQRLKNAGFYKLGGTKAKPKWQLNTKAVKGYVEKIYTTKLKTAPPKTEKGHIKRDRNTLEASGSRVLHLLGEMGALDKIINTYFPIIERGTIAPINPRFNSLVNTGRTSSSKPNFQNLPSGRIIGGVRECFQPRPGYVFCSSDYNQLEMCTLSQVHYFKYGSSVMGDAINAGQDLHNKFAAFLLGIPYGKACELKEAKDPDFKKTRDLAKIYNFGVGGGMQAKGFRKAAYNELRMDIPYPEADRIVKSFGKLYPEQKMLMEWVSEQVGISTFTFKHFVSGRERGLCGYTDGSNSPFQGLAADLVKHAMCRISYEMYAVPDSPLYGSRLIANIHDEFFAEMPEGRASAASRRMEEIMIEAGKIYTPNVKLKVESTLMRYWTKDAEPVYNEAGELEIWECTV